MEERISLLDRSLESGIEPIELFASPVISCLTDSPMAYRTELHINSAELGVLTPAQTDPVAGRTSQCVSLALWNLRTACDIVSDMMRNGATFDWISLRTPPRILTKGNVGDLISTVFADADFKYPAKLCFEFPRESFFADTDGMRRGLKTLASLGIRSSLRGFGDEFCPTSRLEVMPFDFLLLDESITARLGDAETSAPTEALLRYIGSFGCTLFASDIGSDAEREKLNELPVAGYIPKTFAPLTAEQLRETGRRREADGA